MATEGSASAMDDYKALISPIDFQILKTAWRNEKAAPEILIYESGLVPRVTGQIELAEQNIEDFESNGLDPLAVSLYQMDLDRTHFLLRSYLRICLQKIERHLVSHLENRWVYESAFGTGACVCKDVKLF